MRPPGEGAARGRAGGEKDTQWQEEDIMPCILPRHSRVQLLTHIPPVSMSAMFHECARANKRVESKTLGVPCLWVREAHG